MASLPKGLRIETTITSDDNTITDGDMLDTPPCVSLPHPASLP
ncbi:hypothetical protein [Azospirillum thiophilum]|nr:hypothetical protein [Azospirillum thiophilum]